MTESLAVGKYECIILQ